MHISRYEYIANQVPLSYVGSQRENAAVERKEHLEVGHLHNSRRLHIVRVAERKGETTTLCVINRKT